MLWFILDQCQEWFRQHSSKDEHKTKNYFYFHGWEGHVYEYFYNVVLWLLVLSCFNPFSTEDPDYHIPVDFNIFLEWLWLINIQVFIIDVQAELGCTNDDQPFFFHKNIIMSPPYTWLDEHTTSCFGLSGKTEFLHNYSLKSSWITERNEEKGHAGVCASVQNMPVASPNRLELAPTTGQTLWQSQQDTPSIIRSRCGKLSSTINITWYMTNRSYEIQSHGVFERLWMAAMTISQDLSRDVIGSFMSDPRSIFHNTLLTQIKYAEWSGNSKSALYHFITKQTFKNNLHGIWFFFKYILYPKSVFVFMNYFYYHTVARI